MSLGKLSGVIFSFWAGLVFCLLFAFGGKEIVRIAADEGSAVEFFDLFFGRYGGFWTGSLCFMVFVLTVILFKDLPLGIEQDLPEISGHEEYLRYRRRFESRGLALVQSTIYFAIGFAIYSVCQFDTNGPANTLLTLFTALQFSFGGLLGRKLWCTAYILKSIEQTEPPSDLLEKTNLQSLILTVNIFTFLTLVTTLVHTYFHFNMNYQYVALPESMARYLPLSPALLAFPVLIMFNFIPRSTVNRLYIRSIEKSKEALVDGVLNNSDDEFSKQKLLIDYKKHLNEEYRYRQRAALSELPVVLAIVTLVATLLVRLVMGGQ